MKHLLRLAFSSIILICGSALAADPPFPALTGRVVDEAGILSPALISELITQLAEHERTTTNQVVVVTLKSLQGYEIADYSNRLFRHWGIGQKAKNNGVLLVVAPTEHKVRIEVGYGLEGVLTDAISRDIIERRLKPAFRQQDYQQGIRNGINAILSALTGEYQNATPPLTTVPEHNPLRDIHGFALIPFISFLIGIMATVIAANLSAKTRTARRMLGSIASGGVGIFAWMLSGSIVITLFIALFVFLFARYGTPSTGRGGYGGGGWGSSGGWSSGSSGGGFSGGGGSSGGGGASGSW